MRLKRRNRRNKWLPVILLVLCLYVGWLAAYLLWGIDYVYLGLVEKPTPEQQQLTFQIESLRKELTNIPDLVVQREQQLVQAQELLANEQSKMPSALNINNLVRDILELASQCQVKAIPLRTTPPRSKTFGQSSYSYWDISLSVEGDFQNVANFVENIDGKYISTATVVSTVLDQRKMKQDSSNIENYTANVTGTLRLYIYTRPP